MLKSWEYTLLCANTRSYLESYKGGYMLYKIPFSKSPLHPLSIFASVQKGQSSRKKFEKLS